MRSMFQEENVAEGNVLRKLLLESRSFRTLSSDVVRLMLYFKSKPEVPHQDSARRSTISNIPKRQRDREFDFSLGKETSRQR